MRAFADYLLIGVLAVAAMSLITVASVDLTAGARPMPEQGGLIQSVDRSHKGNRLDMPSKVGSETPKAKKQIALPDGCEPAFSPLMPAERPSLTGHCVS